MATTSAVREASADNVKRLGNPKFWELPPIVENDQDTENVPQHTTRGTMTAFEEYLPLNASRETMTRPQARSWALMAVVFIILTIGLTSMVVSQATGNKNLNKRPSYKHVVRKSNPRSGSEAIPFGWMTAGLSHSPDFERPGNCSPVPMEGSVVQKRKECIQEVWEGFSRVNGAVVYYLCRATCRVLFVVKCSGQQWKVTIVDPGPCNCSSYSSSENINTTREIPKNNMTSRKEKLKRISHCVGDPPPKLGCAASDWVPAKDRLGRNTHSRRYMANYVCETGQEEKCQVAQTLECGANKRWRIVQSAEKLRCECKETAATAQDAIVDANVTWGSQ